MRSKARTSQATIPDRRSLPLSYRIKREKLQSDCRHNRSNYLLLCWFEGRIPMVCSHKATLEGQRVTGRFVRRRP